MGQNATINTNSFLVCGLGNLGQYCVSVLKEFGVNVNAIEVTNIQRWEIPELPNLVDNLIIGDCRQPKILEQAGIIHCRAILIVTSDERVNIAAAFAAAAFGENVLNLFRLNGQTTLVTEYQIEANDTLNGKLIAEIAYGYGIVPILHAKAGQANSKLMPSDDIKLAVGDRLIVLATIEGLQRVERGAIAQPQVLVKVESALSAEATFEGAAVISRVSGCDMHTARTLMNQLPETLQYPLYKHQAHRLLSELSKTQVQARIA